MLIKTRSWSSCYLIKCYDAELAPWSDNTFAIILLRLTLFTTSTVRSFTITKLHTEWYRQSLLLTVSPHSAWIIRKLTISSRSTYISCKQFCSISEICFPTSSYLFWTVITTFIINLSDHPLWATLIVNF